MSFALQDEPERGRRLRWLMLGAGAAMLLAAGGLLAAEQVAPRKAQKRRAATMTLVKIPPPKKETPPPPPPPEPVVEVEVPSPAVEPPPPPRRKKRPKKKRPRQKRPEKKVVHKEPPRPAPPATPSPAPPSPAPVQLGLTLTSTSAAGRGPAVQVGNQFGGREAGRARSAVTRPAPGGDRLQPGQPGRGAERTPAVVRKRVRPDYTPEATQAGVEGRMTLVITIEADGTVSKARVIRGLGAGLDEAALAAVKRWLFSPAQIAGSPVRSTRRITIDFVLDS